jgi:pantoate--beta-alanine ligase
VEILTTSAQMQQASRQNRLAKKRIGFVPTMGALHEGHLALVDVAKKHSEVVVMSIFVNPTQFGPGEDFDKYPRVFPQDSQMAEARGVNYLFHPSVEEIYPPGDQTTVVVTELTRGLCGPFRPGHFRGVATVVTKLFNIVEPDVAVFGEKDFQQLAMVRRMVQDLRMNIEIIGMPTLREPSGLAMSSRNQYLDQKERLDALAIYAALQGAQAQLKRGERSVAKLVKAGKEVLAAPGTIQVEYLEIVDPDTLKPLEQVDRPARILTAVRLNGKRLIDNAPLLP